MVWTRATCLFVCFWLACLCIFSIFLFFIFFSFAFLRKFHRLFDVFQSVEHLSQANRPTIPRNLYRLFTFIFDLFLCKVHRLFAMFQCVEPPSEFKPKRPLQNGSKACYLGLNDVLPLHFHIWFFFRKVHRLLSVSPALGYCGRINQHAPGGIPGLSSFPLFKPGVGIYIYIYIYTTA